MADSRNPSGLHGDLNAEDSAGLVDASADKLQILEEDRETISPIVKMRVEVLREIQRQHVALEAKFYEEKTALVDKYLKLYEPFYTKRYEIVNGIAEVEGITDESATNSSKEKGVPGFWLIAMKQNEVIESEIQERDEEALKYLKDIKCFRNVGPKGFKLEFFFETNPFFKNTVLSKTYRMRNTVDPILEKAIGTEIEWFPGKCLTQKTLVKKPRAGSKHTRPITKTVQCDSFFDFFKPPEIPHNAADIDDTTAVQLQNQLEADHDFGEIIKDKLIPHAVSWFTGEAVEVPSKLQDEEEEGEEEDEG